MARKPPEPGSPAAKSLRDQIAGVVAEESNLDRIREIVEEALGAETKIRVICPECGEEFRPSIPDTKRQLDAAIALLEQTEGKAGATARKADVIIVRPPLD